MKASDNLFNLIHSLTRAEKRYFRLFSQMQAGNKNYLKLFDFVESQEEYDESIIKSTFKNEIFIRQLTRTKGYLYDLILKSLRNFYSQESVGTILKGMLTDIYILYQKRMYRQCEKLVLQAKSLALKHEKFLLLLDLLTWQIELMQITYFIGKEKKQIEKAHNEILECLNRYRKINDYLLLSNRVFLMVSKKGFIRTATEKKELQKLFETPLLLHKPHNGSYEESFYYYLCKGLFYYLQMDYVNACYYTSTLASLMELRKEITQEKITQYSAVLNNLCIYQISLKKFKEATQTIQKLKAIAPRQKLHSQELYFIAANLELLLHASRGTFEEGVKFAEKLERERNLFPEKAMAGKFETPMNYRIAYLYFGLNNYRKANYYLNKILNMEEIDLRNDIQCFALIISLIVHYEMGNYELLHYIIKSNFRYLQKKNRLYKFEGLLLEFFKKHLTKSPGRKDMVSGFRQLKENIEKVIEDPLEKNALTYFDILSWIDSKIKKRTFAEIVKEKGKG